jgi:hypothetical protein
MMDIDPRIEFVYRRFWRKVHDRYEMSGRKWASYSPSGRYLLQFLTIYRIPVFIGFPIIESYMWLRSLPLSGFIDDLLEEILEPLLTVATAIILFGSVVDWTRKLLWKPKNESERSFQSLGRLSFKALLIFAQTATPPDQREFALGCLEERFESDCATKGVLSALCRLVRDIRVAYWTRIKGYVNKQVSRVRKSI